MKISAISFIDLDGEVHTYPCRECNEPARIRYNVAGLVFNLCILCLLMMEQKTSMILSELLQEKQH